MEQRVVALGEVLWDIFPQKRTLGGAVANFAFHMDRLGFDSRIVSAVGSDRLGDEVVELYRDKEIRAMIQRVPYPTGTVDVTLDSAGIPTYEIHQGVAWDHIVFTPELEALACRTTAFCFGTLGQRGAESARTVARFLEAMPQGEECYRIFDINLRQHFYHREMILFSLHHCDVLKVNEEELTVLCALFGYSFPEKRTACLRLLAEFGLRILILTCGEHGSYVFTAEGEESFLPIEPVAVVDTVGAGDAFTAGFCAALLSGASILEAHRRAVALSAYVCTQVGGMAEPKKEV